MEYENVNGKKQQNVEKNVSKIEYYRKRCSNMGLKKSNSSGYIL